MQQGKRKLFKWIIMVVCLGALLMFYPPGTVQAKQPIDSIWAVLDDLYLNNLDEQGKAYLDNTMLSWQDVTNDAIEAALKSSLYTEEVEKRLSQANLNQTHLYAAIGDLGSLLYAHTSERIAVLLSYKKTHYRTFHALFNNTSMNSNYMFEFFYDMYTEFPNTLAPADLSPSNIDGILEFINKNPDYLLLLGAGDDKWVAALPGFIDKAFLDARQKQKYADIDKAFGELGWSNEKLIAAEKAFIKLVDPNGESQMAFILSILRQNTAIGGTDGNKMVKNTALSSDQIRGTITVSSSRINESLAINMIINGRNAITLDNLLTTYLRTSFAAWHSDNTSVVNIVDDKLFIKGSGTALITYYRNGSNKDKGWLYKFYVKVE